MSESARPAPWETVTPAWTDRLLKPLHAWIWRDPRRRARKLLNFAETEEDSGRDMTRAAECTRDALLRRLYLRHAGDERRHAEVFRRRAREILAALPPSRALVRFQANWLAPGERGLDDLDVDQAREDELLAFLHLSEKIAVGRFALYRQVLDGDVQTRRVFEDVLQDEAFHMNYTQAQLMRLNPARWRWRLRAAWVSKAWRAYLRVAAAIGALLGGLILSLQYFLVLPVFALLARRHREPDGWSEAREPSPLRSQY
jgi:hypothetical protein